ncbi:response regulator transcription factor [Fulvivirgaceae bacterium BMA10]|uniref:Response regulator transcription factor n=1 Tax=Splendidivirga corallicola TaxID=3051826 RepID=A0ABT8KJE2_9BACT|nr:response regulator transcription factor [Fulvivirgaceae bacterium BMA10]
MYNIKVFVVDDHAIVREGIKAMFKNAPDMELVGEAENGDETIEKLKYMSPDVILLDIVMPGINGIQLTKLIKQAYPHIQIILLSMEITGQLIGNGIGAGASGYLPKDSSKEILFEAIKKVKSGDKFFAESISEVVFDEFFKNSVRGDRRGGVGFATKISDREMEVLKLIASGKSNREVADELFISIRTVDAHRNHIMKKIDARNTADLVKYAIKNKLIELFD